MGGNSDNDHHAGGSTLNLNNAASNRNRNNGAHAPYTTKVNNSGPGHYEK